MLKSGYLGTKLFKRSINICISTNKIKKISNINIEGSMMLKGCNTIKNDVKKNGNEILHERFFKNIYSYAKNKGEHLIRAESICRLDIKQKLDCVRTLNE